MVGSLSSKSGNRQIEKGGKISSADCSGNKFFVGFVLVHPAFNLPSSKITEEA